MIPCSISNLKKYYGKNVGVEDVTFNVKEGEIVGFIGPNGAGKTTTIRAIVGLLKADDGQVEIIGEDANNAANARAELGYAGGEPSFYPNLTVLENLRLVADLKGVSYDRIDYLSSKLELGLSRKAKELSLGNKKKLCIVMALLSSPKFIVLDEPTVGLDPLIKREFFKLIEEEKKRGASILISSHTLTDIQRLCDRVAIIKNGKIIAVEEMQQLKTKRLKKVTIETSYSHPEITLSGVSDVKSDGHQIKFNYNGEMKKLVKYLNSIDLDNISIEDAGLEDMFLHFYE